MPIMALRDHAMRFARLLVALALVILALSVGRAIFVLATAPPPATLPAETLADAGGRFSLVRNTQLYMVEAGPSDGRPIVLVHGLLGSTQDFAELIPVLAQAGYRVLAVDRPPFGLSDKRPSAPMTAAAQADLLAEWLATLGLARAVWLGHSAGGAVVAQLALRHPQKVSALVLVAPQIGTAASDEGAANLLANPVLPVLATIFIQSLNPSAPWAEAELRTYFNESRLRDFLQAQLSVARVSDAMAAGEARFTRAQGWEAGLRAFGRAVLADRSSLRIEELAAALRAPVLIMWGEADAFIPVGRGRRLKEALPSSTLIVYPAAGHQPWRDAPADFTRDLLTFLSTHSSTFILSRL
jgi:pimeloyl-ACP methyl ester carboxylesterase